MNGNFTLLNPPSKTTLLQFILREKRPRIHDIIGNAFTKWICPHHGNKQFSQPRNVYKFNISYLLAAAAEAKKALKENKVDPSTEEKTETGSGIKDGQLKVVRNDQRGKTVERQNRTKDPLLSNAFRAAEPFRAVHFGI